MRAGDDIGDDFGFRRIRYRWLEHTYDGGCALAEPDGFAEHGWILLKPGRPETVGQHRRPGSIRAVVSRVEQPAEHRVQPHHLEIRSADDARADFARLAEPGHGEPDCGEVTKRAQCLDALLEIADLRHRERNVVG